MPFADTDAGRLFAQLVGPPELVSDPDDGRRMVRNPAALAWHEGALAREHEPAEVLRRQRAAYLVGYRMMTGCRSTRNGFDGGVRDGREAEYRRAAARGWQAA